LTGFASALFEPFDFAAVVFATFASSLLSTGASTGSSLDSAAAAARSRATAARQVRQIDLPACFSARASIPDSTTASTFGGVVNPSSAWSN